MWGGYEFWGDTIRLSTDTLRSMHGCSLAARSEQVWDQSRIAGDKKEEADHTSRGLPLWFFHYTMSG